MDNLINKLLNFRSVQDINYSPYSLRGPTSSPSSSRNSSKHGGNVFRQETQIDEFVHFFVQGTLPNVWVDVTHENSEIKNAMFEGIYKPNVKYFGFDFVFSKIDENTFELVNEKIGVLKCIKIKMPFHTGNIKLKI